MILIVILYALFAATFSLGKVLLNYSPPIFLVGIRMFISGLLLLTYQYFFPAARFKFRIKHLSLYIQGILFVVFIPYILRFWGLQYMPASKASLLYNLGPFATFIFSYLLRGEQPTWKKVLGLIIGFVGLLPILIAHAPDEDVIGSLWFLSWPEMAIIISVSCLSYGWLVMHKLITDHNYQPAMANGMVMLAGGLLALITSQVIETQSCITDVIPFITILAIVIIFSNVIGHNFYAMLLRTYSPTFLSFAGFITPLFAALYGWLFFNEVITWHFYVSAAAVFIGLGLFYQDEVLTDFNPFDEG